MQEDDPSKIKESLGIIYKSGDLLLKLLTDLLTFSRNQVEQVATLEEREFRLRDVEEQIYALFAQQAAEKRIHLRITFEDMSFDEDKSTSQLGIHQTRSRISDVDIRNLLLWGDPHRILQVVINLVSNSLKFTPAGGSISLKIRCTAGAAMSVGLSHSTSVTSRLRRSLTFERRHSLHYEDTLQQGTANLIKPHTAIARARREGSRTRPPGQDLYFEFVVQDTGPGIPLDMQQRIFEPFVQGEIGLSRQHGGAGLGLSICSQLASLMGGSMSLSSVPGEGSLFSFHLPLRHVQGSECRSIAASESRHGFVDDFGVFSSSEHVTYDLDDKRPFSVAEELPLRRPALVSRISEAASSVDPGLQTPGSEMTASSLQESMLQSTPSTGTSPQTLDSSKISSATSSGTTASPQGIRVLVAEDNKVNQEVVLRMLKLEKILDVTIANDGQEAVELVEASINGASSSSSSLNSSASSSSSSSFDIIFMDIQMPRLDGLQAARAVRSAGFRNPIIALTAFAEESNVRECYAAGMDFFLAKPIKRTGLRDVVRKFCGVAPATSCSVSTTPPVPDANADGKCDKSPPAPDEPTKEG
jgi:osomolarity two-component system sensor histidine kinase SLN1